jgi:hypothetical protein
LTLCDPVCVSFSKTISVCLVAKFLVVSLLFDNRNKVVQFFVEFLQIFIEMDDESTINAQLEKLSAGKCSFVAYVDVFIKFPSSQKTLMICIALPLSLLFVPHVISVLLSIFFQKQFMSHKLLLLT